MKKTGAPNFARILQKIPSIDAILQTAEAQEILAETGAKRLTNLARAVNDSLRKELQEKISDGLATDFSREDLLRDALERLRSVWQNERQTRLQKVINATGVIIHTNLGRAPLSENARRAVQEAASGYCNLEYNLADGKRGKRGGRVERLLVELTGAESALVVNNCAAAAFFVLTVFASGGEAIISRGELVEIGGDFRVPDVLEQSGARLKEVGTTNRTRAADYERAISENTGLILRVHPSNYRIVGFTQMPNLSELAELAHRHNLIFYEDAGSGAMFDLSKYGLTGEPTISDSIKAGVDVVTFSGDKLLGGAQSGLIVGRNEMIEKLRRHPLYRALRVDKMIYAALEATLEAFHRENALREIPVLAMLAQTSEELKNRAESFARNLRESLNANNALRFEIIEGNSVVGGGSAPLVQPATALLALQHKNWAAAKLEENLRLSNPPVIARILEDKVLLDLRTVSKSDETILLKILAEI